MGKMETSTPLQKDKITHTKKQSKLEFFLFVHIPGELPYEFVENPTLFFKKFQGKI